MTDIDSKVEEMQKEKPNIIAREVADLCVSNIPFSFERNSKSGKASCADRGD
jgi:hypothetical protein